MFQLLFMGQWLDAGYRRPAFFTALPTTFWSYYHCGGLYSIGIIFIYGKSRAGITQYGIFFVLAAAVCHYVAVLLAV